MKYASLIVSIIACLVIFMGIYQDDSSIVMMGVALSCMSMVMPRST